MKKRRQLLLLALGLATATSAMAQAPVVSQVGDDENKAQYPASLGLVENAHYNYAQINTSGAEENLAYITKGADVPFYVAPSYVMNTADYANVKLITDLGTLANKGEFVWKIFAQDGTTPNPVNYVLSATTDNKASVKVEDGATAGEHVRIYVNQELPSAYDAFKGCSDQYTAFEVVAVDKPELHMTAPTIESGSILSTTPFEEVTPYGVAVISAVGEVIPANATVMMYKTCNTNLLKPATKVDLKLEVSEDGAPDELAYYGFSIKGYKAVIKDVFTTPAQDGVAAEWPTATKVHDATVGNNMVAKADVPAEGVFEGTLDFGTTSYVPGKFYDFIFKLEKAKNVEHDGLVSAISMRSYATEEFLKSTDANMKVYDGTTFGFATKTNTYRYAVIRLLIPPKTGPVYHIPVSLFK